MSICEQRWGQKDAFLQRSHLRQADGALTASLGDALVKVGALLPGARRAQELGQFLLVELVGAWQLDPLRVEVFAVDAKFVVQVRAGGETSIAQIANYLLLLHARAAFETARKTIKMRVERGITVAVVDD